MMVVDFSKPLEAIHEDGRIGIVQPCVAPSLPMMAYGGEAGVGYMDSWRGGWRRDGSPIGPNNKWTIRNVATPAKTPPIPAPIAERMRGLIERMAGGAKAHEDGPTRFCYQDYKEATAIMAELVPIDPDLLEARKIEAQICREADNESDAARAEKGEFDDRPGMKGVLAAIKRGRELERKGRK